MILDGLKVVELATHIAAPGAGGMLAQWGADVIKVEPHDGDPMRRGYERLSPSGISPAFEMDNRGKRSVVLDIREPEGRGALSSLIRHADIFLTSTRPSALRRAGLDWASLQREHPRLIHASVSGYGTSGPDADLPGYDVAAFWARSGAASLMAPKGVEPFPIRTGMGDHSCSMAITMAIMAALYDRERTGRGRAVDASLLRTGTFAVSSDLSIYSRLGRVKSTRPRRQSSVPLVNFFRSLEGDWFCLMPRSHRTDWPAIARAAMCEELIEDSRFATPEARAEHVTALVDALDAGFGAQPMAQLREHFRAADLVWAPVQTPAEVWDDEQARAAGCFTQAVDSTGADMEVIAAPVSFGSPDRGLAVPKLDQHGHAIRAALPNGRWPANNA